MGIKYQFRRKIFLPEFNAMNLYPPWRFPLGPRQIVTLVLGAWILRGLSSSCTWQFCPSYIRRCFYKSKVLPGIMVVDQRLSEIPPFFGKKFSIFTVLRTIWVVRSFVILWKRSPWQVALPCSFITLICFSMSGTYSFAAAKFTSGTPDRDSIRIFKDLNLTSACTVVMWNPKCR